MKCAIYTRVSTEEQVERYSLETQREVLSRWAEALGHEVVDTYVDPGYSGALEDRPGLNRLLADAKDRRFDVLLIYRLDRLARKVRLAYDLIERLENAGVGLMSYAEPNINTTTPIGKAVLGIMAVFAEWERDTFAERSRLGIRKAIRMGKYFGGVVPYGYTVENSRLALHPDEAAVVAQMFTWVAEKGWSTNRVAEELNRLGVATKYRSEGRGVRGKRTAGVWRGGGVLRILNNRTYIGEYTYGKRTSKPQPELITVTVPPVIDPALFEAVQVRLEQNMRFAARNNRHVYLLKGLIRCGQCGRTYIGSFNTVRFYYACVGRANRQATSATSTRCKAPHVRGKEIEEIVWNDIKGFLQNPGEALNAFLNQDTVRESEVSLLERRLESLIMARSRLLDLYLEGGVNKDVYYSRIEELEGRIKDIQAAYDEARRKELEEKTRRESLATLESLSARVRENIDQLSPEERQSIARELVERITVYPAENGGGIRAEIRYRFVSIALHTGRDS
jgi:site-specific DNA recombinase